MSGPAPVFQLPTSLSPSSPLHLSTSHLTTTNGRLSQDPIKLAWLVRGDTIHTVNTEDGEEVARWRAKDCDVLCKCELKFSYRASLLVMALETNNRHVLGVLDPLAPRLIRAIAVPHQITSLHPVSADNINTPGLFSHSIMSLFSGIVAVGCKGGHVYLVDLALTNRDAPTPSLLRPSQLYFIDPNQGIVHTEVSQAVESGAHICVELTAKFHSGRNFIYHSRDLTPLKQFPSQSVFVTALHFAPQICSLAVGYSFGCFQLFNLSQLSLLHSSTCSYPLPPVTHLTHLEPENDPRCFFYVWVGRGALPFVEGSDGCQVRVTLYQLAYEGKTNIGPAEVLYQNFQGCGPRLEYALTPTPSLPNPRASTSSQLLQCFTVERKRSGRGLDESHDDDVHCSVDATLAVFIWSCGVPPNCECFVGVFDINQWYHAQMPNVVRWRMSGRYTGVLGCSYFAFFNLNPALKSDSEIPQLLDARVYDVTPFSSQPPVPESFLWPTALSFRVCGLTRDGIITCHFSGLQRTALHELLQSRALGLAEPQRVFQLCEEAELLGGTWEHGTSHTDVNLQRKALLSVALEHDLVPVLMVCAQQWMTGGASGCDTSLMVEWIGQKMEEIADEKDHLCHPLFSGSAHLLDVPTPGRFSRLVVMWKVLSKLVALLARSEHEQGVQELLGTHYCTAMVQCRLLEVIKWCVRRRLLPAANDVSSDGCFSYPSAALAHCYDMLRDSQNAYKLAVDYLTEELLEGEDYPYPASTFDDFLSVFTTPNLLAQHCLMMYFLCDLAAMDKSSDGSHQLLTHYSRSFALPHQLVAFARGLWCTDHHNYEDALQCLLACQPERVQWFPWQHMVVVSSLLRTGHASLALAYLTAYDRQMDTVEDTKLKISVMVSSGHISAALDAVRVYEASEFVMEMFTHFLDACFQAKVLCRIPELPLNDLEEEYFAGYLEGHPCLACQELLIMFLLSRHRHLEALSQQEKIRPLAQVDPDPKVRERHDYRQALLAGYTSTVPTVLKKLPTQPKQQRGDTLKITVDPGKPLSAVLRKEVVACGSRPPRSQAGLIFTLIENREEARSMPAEPLSPFRSEGSSVHNLKHAPFLSTPLSVRKVRKGPHLVQPTPVHQLPTPSVPENSALFSFMNHMQSFRERMVSMSSQSGTSCIDDSIIRTPLPKTPRSAFRPTPSHLLIATPPSILKVKPTATAQEMEEEGGGGGGEDGQNGEEKQHVTSVGHRKIRFAVEGTLLPSPESPPHDHPPRMAARMPTPYAPSHPSSLVTTSLAMTTPLPSDSDSDLFLSPVESPSELSPPTSRTLAPTPSHPLTPTPSHPQASSSTPSPPQPKLQLFATNDPETSVQPDDPMDNIATPPVTIDKDTSVEPMAEETQVSASKPAPQKSPFPQPELNLFASKDPETSVQPEDPMENIDTPPFTIAEDTSEEPMTEETQMAASKVAPRKSPFSPLSISRTSLPDVSVRLTRQSIGSLVQVRDTPSSRMSLRSQTLVEVRGTPSSRTSLRSQTSPAVSTPLLVATSKTPTSGIKPDLFTPLLTSEIVEAKKKKLVSYIEAAKQTNTSYVRSPLVADQVTTVPGQFAMVTTTTATRTTATPVKKVNILKDVPSATMIVPPPVVPVEKTVQEQFSFSAPTEVSPPGPPVASLLRQETPVSTSLASFVFSPPLTRSAARKQKVRVPAAEKEETTAVRTGAQKQTRSRSRRGAYPTSNTQPTDEDISLVTPPNASFPQNEEKKPAQRRRAKPVRTVKGTRRSTRLLGERK